MEEYANSGDIEKFKSYIAMYRVDEWGDSLLQEFIQKLYKKKEESPVSQNSLGGASSASFFEENLLEELMKEESLGRKYGSIISTDSLGGGASSASSSSSNEEDSQKEDSQKEKSFSKISEKNSIIEKDFRMVLSLTSLHNGDFVISALDE